MKSYVTPDTDLVNVYSHKASPFKARDLQALFNRYLAQNEAD